MHFNCLIIDDEVDLAKMTCEYFQMFDIACIWTDSISGYERITREHTFDLLLLDINLQEESGFRLCKEIRETSDIPILFISARQSDDDVLIALNIGGDDYIKKPYSLSVLLAKVKIILKRMVNKEVSDSEPELRNRDDSDRLRLEENTLKVYVNGNAVSLKAKEFKLLKCLSDHRNTIVTKEELFNTVWGDTYFSDGTLNVHIRKLREKIEENPNQPVLIKTVWGVGYILEIEEH